MAPPKPPQREDVEKEGKELEVEKTQSKPKPLLDFSVFKDRGFLIYTIAASIMVSQNRNNTVPNGTLFPIYSALHLTRALWHPIPYIVHYF